MCKTRKLGNGTWTYRLLSYVLVLAMVIGSIVIPTPVEVKATTGKLILGTENSEAVWNADQTAYQFSNLEIGAGVTENIKTILVDVTSGTIALPADIATAYGGNVIFKDVDLSSYIINFGESGITKENAQKLLRRISFVPNTTDDQTVTIKLDNGKCIFPEGVKPEEVKLNTMKDDKGRMHYYMCVPVDLTEDRCVSWLEAYDMAKNWTLMGRRGYLTTITSKEENAVVIKIGAWPGWAGGIRYKKGVFNDGKIAGSAIPGQLGIEYLYDNFWFEGDEGHNKESDWTPDKKNWADKSWFGPEKWIWACGPELNESFSGDALDNTSAERLWAEDEPTNNFFGVDYFPSDLSSPYDVSVVEGCLELNFAGSSSKGWNDYRNRPQPKEKIQCYFVEFGGYGPGQDPAEKTGNGPAPIDEESITVPRVDSLVKITGTITGDNGDDNNYGADYGKYYTINLVSNDGVAYPVIISNEDSKKNEYTAYVAKNKTYTVDASKSGTGVDSKIFDNPKINWNSSMDVQADDRNGIPIDLGNTSSSSKINVNGTITGVTPGTVGKVVLTDKDGVNHDTSGGGGTYDNTNGTFQIPSVPKGAYTVTVYGTDNTTVLGTRTGTIPSGATDPYPMTVDLTKSKIAVSGTVNGSNRDNAKKVVFYETGTKNKVAECDVNPGNKSYRISGLTPGTIYDVEVQDEKGRDLYATTKSVNVPAEATGTITQDLIVNKGNPKTVNVTVTGENVDAANEVQLCDPTTGNMVKKVDLTTAGTSKTGTISGVEPGDYKVKVLDKNGQEIPATPGTFYVDNNSAVTTVPLNLDALALIKVTGTIGGNATDEARSVKFVDTNDASKVYDGEITKRINQYSVDVPAGTYNVIAIDKNGNPLGETFVTYSGDINNITVSTTAKVHNFDINYKESSAAKVTVSGTITGSKAGEADKVILTPIDADGKQNGKAIERDTSDGSYRVPNVPEGTYKVTVKDAGGNDILTAPGIITVSQEDKTKNLVVGRIDEVKQKIIDEIEKAAAEDKERVDDKFGVSDADKDKAKADIDNAKNAAINDLNKPENQDDPYGKVVVPAIKNMEKIVDALGDKVTSTNLQKAKDEAKEAIDNLPNLTETEKQSHKNDVDNAGDSKGVDEAVLKAKRDDAKKEIDKLPNLTDDEKKNDKKDVDNADTGKQIADALLEAIKDDAKKALDKEAAEDKAKVDAILNITPAEQEQAKKDIDKEKDAAKQKVDDARNKNSVNEAVKDGIKKMDDVVDGLNGGLGSGTNTGLEKEKEDAKKEIDQKADDAKKLIDKTGLTDDLKKELKDQVDKAAKDAKDAIDKAKTSAEVKQEKDDGKKTIDSLLSITKLSVKEVIKIVEILKTSVTEKELEKEITKTNADKGEIAGSRFSKIRLKATPKGKTSIKLNWVKQSNADGYFVYGASCGDPTLKKLKTITKKNTTTWTQKGRKKKTYYKYVVFAYKNVAGQKRIIERSNGAHATTPGGKKGNTTKVMTDKKTYTVKVKKTAKIKATYKCNKKVEQHIAVVRYESTNPKVAKVGKYNGKITGVKKGSCYIYVFTQNGFWKKVKVKVK